MTPSAAAPEPPPCFSAELRRLGVVFRDRPGRVGEILALTRERGYHFLLLLIVLPFVGPVPLPGFSLPFGLAVALLGLGLGLDRKPWLPRWLLQRELSARTLGSLLETSSRIMRGLELFLRPRLARIPASPALTRLSGLLIAVSGLMLPFPLPFSNSLPAWTVILLTVGRLGRDGLFILGGLAAFLLSVAFFTFVALTGAAGLEWIHRALR
jgi:hypothetical protein